tara:strand:- start:187 stop:378 length:192 start_codon:yes stop_codon:yes gene_type:complete
LCSASGVLGSTAGDELGGVVVQEVFVDTEMLFFGENGVVGFEVVLFEERWVAYCLDIWNTIST